MKKYELSAWETKTYSHNITIETEQDIDNIETLVNDVNDFNEVLNILAKADGTRIVDVDMDYQASVECEVDQINEAE